MAAVLNPHRHEAGMFERHSLDRRFAQKVGIFPAQDGRRLGFESGKQIPKFRDPAARNVFGSGKHPNYLRIVGGDEPFAVLSENAFGEGKPFFLLQIHDAGIGHLERGHRIGP